MAVLSKFTQQVVRAGSVAWIFSQSAMGVSTLGTDTPAGILAPTSAALLGVNPTSA